MSFSYAAPRATAAKLVLGWTSDKPTQRRHFKPLLAAVRLSTASLGIQLGSVNKLLFQKTQSQCFFSLQTVKISQSWIIWLHFGSVASRVGDLLSQNHCWIVTLQRFSSDTPWYLVWILHMLNKLMVRSFCSTALSACDLDSPDHWIWIILPHWLVKSHHFISCFFCVFFIASRPCDLILAHTTTLLSWDTPLYTVF